MTPLQVGVILFPVIGLIIMAAVVATVYSSIEIVEEGDVYALLVFGEYRTVLQPGINFVPPFVSTIYPVDPDELRIEKPDGSVPLPEESHDRAREVAGIAGEDDEYGIEYE